MAHHTHWDGTFLQAHTSASASFSVCEYLLSVSVTIPLLLGEYRSQSNWAGISNYKGWGIFV